MRSNKLVAITVGTALLGATGLVGIAATATQAAPETRPVPAPAGDAATDSGTETGGTVSLASPLQWPLSSSPQDAGRTDPVAADPAAPNGAQRTPESALADVRRLIRDGVPGASPELDALLQQTLRTADHAVTTLQAHTSARDLTRSWVHAMRPAGAPGSWALPGVSALEKVYGTDQGANDTRQDGASGAAATPAGPAVPSGSDGAAGAAGSGGSGGTPALGADTTAASPRAAAPQAAAVTLVDLPDLGPLLDAVTALDSAAALDALTDLLGGVLSTLTSTVFGITGSLVELT